MTIENKIEKFLNEAGFTSQDKANAFKLADYAKSIGYNAVVKGNEYRIKVCLGWDWTEKKQYPKLEKFIEKNILWDIELAADVTGGGYNALTRN